MITEAPEKLSILDGVKEIIERVAGKVALGSEAELAIQFKSQVQAMVREAAMGYVQQLIPKLISGMDEETKREYFMAIAALALGNLMPKWPATSTMTWGPGAGLTPALSQQLPTYIGGGGQGITMSAYPQTISPMPPNPSGVQNQTIYPTGSGSGLGSVTLTGGSK